MENFNGELLGFYAMAKSSKPKGGLITKLLIGFTDNGQSRKECLNVIVTDFEPLERGGALEFDRQTLRLNGSEFEIIGGLHGNENTFSAMRTEFVNKD
jgi:hypothetical protein